MDVTADGGVPLFLTTSVLPLYEPSSPCFELKSIAASSTVGLEHSEGISVDVRKYKCVIDNIFRSRPHTRSIKK